MCFCESAKRFRKHMVTILCYTQMTKKYFYKLASDRTEEGVVS